MATSLATCLHSDPHLHRSDRLSAPLAGLAEAALLALPFPKIARHFSQDAVHGAGNGRTFVFRDFIVDVEEVSPLAGRRLPRSW